MLHTELKSNVVSDISRTAGVPLTSASPPVICVQTAATSVPTVATCVPPAATSVPTAATSMPTQPPLSHFSHQKWQTELVMHVDFTDVLISVIVVMSVCDRLSL